jgi:hypothetical protein
MGRRGTPLSSISVSSGRRRKVADEHLINRIETKYGFSCRNLNLHGLDGARSLGRFLSFT